MRRSRKINIAIIIAAFGDPGLIAARETFQIPIVGLGEASMLSACLFGKKFSIISFTQNMKSWYQELRTRIDFQVI